MHMRRRRNCIAADSQTMPPFKPSFQTGLDMTWVSQTMPPFKPSFQTGLDVNKDKMLKTQDRQPSVDPRCGG